MAKAAKFDFTFLKKKKEAKDTFSFYFDTSSLGFSFKPGQYVKLTLPSDDHDERGSSRYFTISSSPKEKNFISITTKIIKSTFKLKLANLSPGEKVKVFGPIGYFDFDFFDQKPKVFLSGGMGITPFRSLLSSLDIKEIATPIILISSFPNKDNVIFFDEFKAYERTNPENIKIVFTLTEEKIDGFEKGRIGDSLIKKYVDKDSKFFIVGPESFEYEIKERLRSLGVFEENIFTENFPGY